MERPIVEVVIAMALLLLLLLLPLLLNKHPGGGLSASASILGTFACIAGITRRFPNEKQRIALASGCLSFARSNAAAASSFICRAANAAPR
jgi:multisubunit Na+/H+ antiporter MnhB subunit